MRISVKTTNQVRIMLDLTSVKSQRRIVNGDQSHYQVTLADNRILDIQSELPDIPLDPEIDITKKFLNRLKHKIEKK